MIFSDAARRARDALRQAGIDNPGHEARLLLGHLLGLAPNILPDAAAEIDPDRLDALLARRAAREPMAYILGSQGFWTLDLEVSPATLIPRADSEALIEAALAARPDRGRVRRILDLGTGTGCLLLAALEAFPDAWGLGIDLVPEAAALARRNAVRAGLAGRAGFACGDWAAAIDGRFDMILSNPPYIETGGISGLMQEVAAFEPRSALDGGVDGLDAYRRLIPALPRLLAPGGVAIFELGAGQASAVIDLARSAGCSSPALRQDLGGVARALVLEVAGIPAA